MGKPHEAASGSSADWPTNYSGNHPANDFCQQLERKYWLTLLAAILLSYSILCLLTSFWLEGSVRLVLQEQVPPSADSFTVGPFTVERPNSVYLIALQHEGIPWNNWSYIDSEVLDQNQQFLFGFGEELSRYQGVDSGEYWSESHTKQGNTVTFQEVGTYYLQFSVESSSLSSQMGPITVKIHQKRASPLPHLWLGFLALAIGSVLHIIAHKDEWEAAADEI